MSKLELLYNSALLVGFLFQTINISLLYFDYKTVTKIVIYTPNKFSTPDLAVCYNYADLINLTWFNQQFGTRLKRGKVRNLENDKFKRKIQSLVTFEQVFKHTPNEVDLIDRCSLRFPSSYAFIEHDKKFCDSNFQIKKFIQQEFICYQFSLKETFIYEFSVISYAPEFSGMMYSIDLKSKYLKAAKSGKMFLLSSSGRIPYEASAFAPNFLIARREDLDIGYYWLTFSMLTNVKLEYPYDTNCIDYMKVMNTSSEIECFRDCVNSVVKKYFGKGHFISITYSRGDDLDDDQRERIISGDDIDDEPTSNLLNQLELGCRETCSRSDCNQKYTITNVFSDPNDDNITIKYLISSPQEPFVKINSIVKMQILEYLIFILSSTSIWFGFYFLMLDPRKLACKLWQPEVTTGCSFCKLTRWKLNQRMMNSFNVK